MKTRHVRKAAWLWIGLTLTACASRRVDELEKPDRLPEEITPELAARFEVRELVPAAPTPKSSTSSPSGPGGHGGNDEFRPQDRPRSSKTRAAAKTTAGKAGAAPPREIYPNRRGDRMPLRIGERHEYEVTYLGVAAGKFVIETLPPKSVSGRKVFHVKATAESSSVFSLFYRLNDTIETFIDSEGLFSHKFHLRLDESKQQRDAIELQDQEKLQTFYWNRWHHVERGKEETKQFAPIEPLAQDSLSALTYMRFIDLPIGKTLTYPLISEARNSEIVVEVVRREELGSPMGRVRTIVVKPAVRFRGVLTQSGDSYIWITDDDRRVIVQLQAQVKIGSVFARLKKVEGGGEAP